MKRISVLAVCAAMALCMVGVLAGCVSSEYTPEANEQTVSDSALTTSGTLCVGVNASNAPYAQESSGSIKGIDVDIAAALADEMGITLEIVDVGTSAGSAFETEEVDIVMGVTSDDEADCWLSSTYAASGVVLYSLTEGATPPSEAGSFVVAAQSSSMSAWEVGECYGEDCLEEVSDLQTAFESLSTGAVNYVAADSVIGGYVIHSSDIEAYPIALLSDVTTYCVAAESTDTELQSAVSEALAQLSAGGVIDVIESKWLGEQTDVSTLSAIGASSSDSSSDSDD